MYFWENLIPMLQKATLIRFLFVFGFTQAFSTVYYVASDGIDTNAGTISAPFLTVQRARTSSNAGETFYIRGGNYIMTEAQFTLKPGIYAYVTNLTKSGSAGKPINYWAYPGEFPAGLSGVKAPKVCNFDGGHLCQA